MEKIEIIKPAKTPLQKVWSVIVNIICILIVVACALVCTSTIYCKSNNTISSIGGYSAVTIAPTGSMRKSGFNDYDVVLVKKCNVKALKGDQLDSNGNVLIRGDIIAYYNYNYAGTEKFRTLPIYTRDMAAEHSYSVNLSFLEFLGKQNSTITYAAKQNRKMIFHHIKEIRIGEDGRLFFKTYGSSNPTEDEYWIDENVIVGKYCEDASPLILTVFKTLATPYGIFLLISIPLFLVLLMVLGDILKALELANLEGQVISGKLSLSDPICVANHIGYNMSEKTKYRYLAQLSPQERIESINLLWKNPRDQQYLKKHYIKQKLLMHYDEERDNLQKEYAEILKANPNSTKLAKEYTKKLEDISKREADTIHRLKLITKHANAVKKEELLNKIDDKVSLNNIKTKLKKGEKIHVGPHKSEEAKKIVENFEKIETEKMYAPSYDSMLSNKDISDSVALFKKNIKYK